MGEITAVKVGEMTLMESVCEYHGYGIICLISMMAIAPDDDCLL